MQQQQEQWQRVSAFVKAQMKALPISQAELARRAGVSPPLVRGLLRGAPRGEPRPENLVKVSVALWGEPDVLEQILAGGAPPRTLVVPAGATPEEPSNADLMRVLELVRGVVADTNVVLRLIAENRRIAVPASTLRVEDPPEAVGGRRTNGR